ncbi:hypothetical protein D3C72_1021510 [compost metagenome]
MKKLVRFLPDSPNVDLCEKLDTGGTVMSSFTDEEREAEARRRQRQTMPTGPFMLTCLHCQRTIPAHEVTSREYPICDTCI